MGESFINRELVSCLCHTRRFSNRFVSLCEIETITFIPFIKLSQTFIKTYHSLNPDVGYLTYLLSIFIFIGQHYFIDL